MVLLPLFWAILSLFVTLVFFLLLPVKVAFSGKIHVNEGIKSGRGSINIGGKNYGIAILPYPRKKILIGNYNRPFFSFFLSDNTKKPKSEKKKSRNKKKKKPSYLHLFGAILKTLYFDEFNLFGSIGFPNPMHTGWLMGGISLIKSWVSGKQSSLILSPRFNNRFETRLTGNICIKFQPAKVAWYTTISYYKFRK